MRHIETSEAYLEAFPDDQQRGETLRYALDTRKFEIELYWRRATYFWTLTTVLFVGYFTLSGQTNNSDNLTYLVTCLGVVLSLGWYLVNRGSKYWQENWEAHVAMLEPQVIGPLFSTTLSRDRFQRRRFWDIYPYSVSQVNQFISLFVWIVWLGLAVGSMPNVGRPDSPTDIGLTSLTVLTAATVLILILGATTHPPTPASVDFVMRE